MKKNLLTVVILALLIVNLVLTGIIMFSTVSANNISVSYGKNDRAGMNAGSVTVKGTSCEYFGTVTAKFNISEYEIKNKMLK